MTQLSKRAQSLLIRLKAGAYYEAYSPKTPKAMQELIDADLVGFCGRTPLTVLYYVPKGFVSAKEERLPGDGKPRYYTVQEVLDRQAELVKAIKCSDAKRETIKAALALLYRLMVAEANREASHGH